MGHHEIAHSFTTLKQFQLLHILKDLHSVHGLFKGLVSRD
jgi:hypothetical protein